METSNNYYFQDNNEKLIFKILAETLKKSLDQILEQNQPDISNENTKYENFCKILKSTDSTSLNDLLLNENDLNSNENEIVTNVENCNTIISRIVLKVIEDSSKSIEKLKKLKIQTKKAEKNVELNLTQTSVVVINHQNNGKSNKTYKSKQFNQSKHENGQKLQKNFTGNLYRCVVCSKKYTNRQKLRAHLKKHLNSKIFNCPNCIRKFSKKNELKAHLNFFCKEIKKNISINQNGKNADNNIHISSNTMQSNTIWHDLDNSKENKQQISSFNPMEFMRNNYKRENNNNLF